jgi:hypothetical protein
MDPMNLTKVLKNYESRWVALSEDNQSILGYGNTAKEASDNAIAQGHSDFTLLYVQPSDLLYCG